MSIGTFSSHEAVVSSAAYRDATYGPFYYAEAITLCMIAVLMALYKFAFILERRGWWGAEDYMVLCSMIFLIIITVLGAESFLHGFGHHEKVIDSIGGNIHLALKYFWLFQIFYKLVICFNKLAFLVLYLRVFTDAKFRTICWISIGVIITSTLGFIIATILQCVPIYKAWDKTAPGRCIDNSAFRWSWAAFNTATDLWVVFLPIPSVLRLQMSTSKKIGTAAMFALGLLTCAASAVRMQALVKSTTTDDATYYSAPAFIWTHVEAAVSLICVCLPALKPVLSKLLPKSTGYYSRRRTGHIKSSGYVMDNFSHAGHEVRSNNLDSYQAKTPYGDSTRITTTNLKSGRNSSFDSSRGRSDSQEGIVQQPGIVVTHDISVSRSKQALASGRRSLSVGSSDSTDQPYKSAGTIQSYY